MAPPRSRWRRWQETRMRSLSPAEGTAKACPPARRRPRPDGRTPSTARARHTVPTPVWSRRERRHGTRQWSFPGGPSGAQSFRACPRLVTTDDCPGESSGAYAVSHPNSVTQHQPCESLRVSNLCARGRFRSRGTQGRSGPGCTHVARGVVVPPARASVVTRTPGDEVPRGSLIVVASVQICFQRWHSRCSRGSS